MRRGCTSSDSEISRTLDQETRLYLHKPECTEANSLAWHAPRLEAREARMPRVGEPRTCGEVDETFPKERGNRLERSCPSRLARRRRLTRTHTHTGLLYTRSTRWLAKSPAQPEEQRHTLDQSANQKKTGAMPAVAPASMHRRQRQQSAPPPANHHSTSVTLHFKERNNPKQPLCASLRGPSPRGV